MSRFSRLTYLLVATALHATVLWGITFGPPAFISTESEQGDSVEVGLVASELTPEPPAPEPPAPEPPAPEPPAPEPPAPEPPAPEPPAPEPPAPEPPASEPPDAISEQTPAPERLKPTPKAAQESKPKRAVARPSAPATGAPANTQAPIRSPGWKAGKPLPGDSAHATWRNGIKPAYPTAARAANQSGRVLIIVNINALGQVVGAQIYSSSGFPSLDQAALAAARASTYNPRKFAGIPLPDTITVPYSFRLNNN